MSADKIAEIAAEIIARDDVQLLIGWRRGTYGLRVTPSFVRKPEDVRGLLFSPLSVHNLATYLAPPHNLLLVEQNENQRKIAIMVKGCDSRAVVQLVAEKVIDRENLLIIGCPCQGVIDRQKAARLVPEAGPAVKVRWHGDKILFEGSGRRLEVRKNDIIADRCLHCRFPNPVDADLLLGDKVEWTADHRYKGMQELEQKKLTDRWLYWKEHFASCLRCYACRNACPLCYCDDCILERLHPGWLWRSNDLAENTAFHLFRAWHLAGRCVECGACERACPMGIPLTALYQKTARDILNDYAYQPGLDSRAGMLPLSLIDDRLDLIL